MINSGSSRRGEYDDHGEDSEHRLHLFRVESDEGVESKSEEVEIHSVRVCVSTAEPRIRSIRLCDVIQHTVKPDLKEEGTRLQMWYR